MTHTIRLSVLVAALAVSTGCNHLTTKVPGVLDLRSDGAMAPTESKAAMQPRSGFEAILNGDGVTGGSDVKIVDRKYWVLRLLPVMNESATEEISGAMGPGGALRNVKIGEQYTFTDWGIGFCGAAVPLVGQVLAWVLPPLDFHFWGTRIKPVPDGLPPPADGIPPLTPEAAPAPAPAPAPAATP